MPDFPKPGILYRDITPLLRDQQGIELSAQIVAEKIKQLPQMPTVISGPESRGFIFGVALAKHLSLGFVPIRKAGKLPRETYQHEYELEYGKDILEIHKDAFNEKDRVLLIDDLLATGGTAQACVELIKKTQAKTIAAVFIIELLSLKGRELLDVPCVETLIQYD